MVTIRRFEGKDQKQVQDLITAIMSQEFKDQQDVYPTFDIQDVPSAYGGLGEAFFVAVNQENDEVVGTAAIKREDNRVALMRRLFVAAPFRNKHIGMRLIDRALEFCAEVGYKEVVFKTTSKMQSATQICQKRGFVPRAKLQMGPIDLIKLSFSIRDGFKKNQKKEAVEL